MELSSQDSLTHRISNFLARTTSLIRIKWFLFLIERAFIWAKVTWRSWLESECLTGPGWGWTSPLRTKVTSTGLKDAVWLVKYATLALENFLRVRGAKWPSARSGTGGRSRLNSFEFDLNSSQNDQGYEEKFVLCCGSASSTENSRGTKKQKKCGRHKNASDRHDRSFLPNRIHVTEAWITCDNVSKKRPLIFHVTEAWIPCDKLFWLTHFSHSDHS